MPRVKKGKTKHKKRERLLKEVKGFKWGRKKKKRAAKEALLHARRHAFYGRKQKKRDYRQLWNVRINAAARQHGMIYSTFIRALKDKNIKLDRKILADLAVNEPEVFAKIVETVKKS